MMNRKIALVTGANRGIGLETVRQLASNGIHTILTARNEAKGRETVASLKEEGLLVDFQRLDVTNEQQAKAVAAAIEKTYGGLDILINNAGVYLDESESIDEVTPKTFEDTLHVNLFGPFYLIQALLPMMKKNNYGRIVNISSGYGSNAALRSAQVGSYKLSKNALNGMTQLFADAVKDLNIKINAADPGWVHTEMGGKAAPRSPEQAAEGILKLALLKDDGPSGRFFFDGEPKEW
ncbi:SDR family oxidoreductase [Sungkyunkwania multivorans]|uniref:SDR family oxidoreductase n=1 Tax=Sungkyunkwania multivorans TaxID=1173618 RepID=A0ABW3CYK8_9FLAO